MTLLSAAVFALTLGTASAQTKITPAKNGYTPAQDVQLGQEASAQVRKELPLLDDDAVDGYVEDVGRRLVSAIPREFQHPEFRYTFDVINQKEINAFALPGGPMFLNRGMIEASKSEAEMAGVMAHEISHVALRHGTAQATKAQKFEIGALAGQVLGAIVGGTAGSIIAQGSQFGLGTYFLKYGREAEREADLLGAQILARAGYDPRQMANMFRTIEQQSGGARSPEWLSSHPNPGNRFEAINREAAMLRVEGSAPSNGQFTQVKSRLTGMSPALTAQQIAEQQKRGGSQPTGTAGRAVQVEPPSNRYRSYTKGNFLRLSVPENWSEVSAANTSVTYAPQGAYFQAQGGTAFTHGVEVGIANTGTNNLQQGTEGLIQSFAQSNPQLRRAGGYKRENISGRNGLTTTLTNVSEVTGSREVITVSTVQLDNTQILFMIGVAPEQEARNYQNAFANVRKSVQIANAR